MRAYTPARRGADVQETSAFPRDDRRVSQRRFAPSEGGTPSLRGSSPELSGIPERGHLALDWASGTPFPSAGL